MTSESERDDGELFYESLVQSYVEAPRFLRRDWLAERVDQAMARPDCRFVLLTGEPGAGKTAFMAQLADDHPGWPRYFIRRDSRTPLESGEARAFILALGHQLAALHPELFLSGKLEVSVRQQVDELRAAGRVVGAEIEELILSPFQQTARIAVEQGVRQVSGELVGLSVRRVVAEASLLGPNDLLALALLAPARLLLAQAPEERIVILVDALDELRYQPAGENIVKWLAACPELPTNVRLVLASRPETMLDSFKRRQERWLACEAIEPGSDEVQADLRRYASAFAREPATQKALVGLDRPAATLVEAWVDKADGNFQYLAALFKGIDAAGDEKERRRLLAAEEVPAGLDALYDFFLGLIRDDVADYEVGREPAWEGLFQPVLGVLAVARGPLSAAQIRRLAGIRAEERWVQGALDRLSQFLDVDGPCCRLYHASFPEFLTSPRTRERHPRSYLSPGEWHVAISEHYWQSCQGKWSDCEHYGLQHLAHHLFESGDRQRLGELVKESWMSARFADDQHSYSGFLSDIELAQRAIQDKLSTSPDAQSDGADFLDLFRLNLIQSSLNSLSRDIPPSLLAQAVTTGLWSPRRALDTAARLPIGAVRATAYQMLLDTGRLDPDEAAGARRALESIAGGPAAPLTDEAAEPPGVLPGQQELEQALVHILLAARDGTLDRQTDQERSAGIYSWLADQLDVHGPWRALSKALQVGSSPQMLYSILGVRASFTGFNPAREWHRLFALALEWAWNDPLAQNYTAEALSLVGRMPDVQRHQALEALALHSTQDSPAAILRAALALEDPARRESVLGTLAPHLPGGLLQEALHALRQIRGDEVAQLQLLTSLLPELAGASRDAVSRHALDVALRLPATDPVTTSSPRAQALLALLPVLPEGLCQEAIDGALAATRAIPVEANHTLMHKALALAAVVPFCAAAERQHVVEEALALVDTDKTDEPMFVGPIVAALSSYMESSNLVRMAGIGFAGLESRDAEDQLRADWEVFQVLNRRALGQVLLAKIERVVWSEALRAQAFALAIPHLPAGLLDQALDMASHLGRESEKARALQVLGPYLDKQQAMRALQVAQHLSSLESRAAAVSSAIRPLEERDRAEALDAVFDWVLASDDARAQAVAVGTMGRAHPEWVCSRLDVLRPTCVRLMKPGPEMSRGEWLERAAHLLPLWFKLTSSSTPEQIAAAAVEVWQWQWE